MKDLVKQYIDGGLSRRRFLTSLTAMGLSVPAARAVAAEFSSFFPSRAPGAENLPPSSPFVSRANDSDAEDLPAWIKPMRGTGAQLLVAQLKAAGVDHIFLNASTGESAVLDALVDEPDIHIIKSVHEGSLVAMADGYARATGKTPFVMFARPGLPNAMSMMFNAWKDYIPMVVMVDDVSMGMLGQDGFEAMDHMTSMTQTMTKWHWPVSSAEKIPEVTRRAFKFASTRPCRPVFMAVPADLLFGPTAAAIMAQEKFNIPMRLEPDRGAIESLAALLLEARNPMILAGDEVVYCQAEKELLELAELLGSPVAKSYYVTWSKPFPSTHPLYVGDYQATSRFPGKVDVMLNLGSRMPVAWGGKLQVESHVKVAEVRLDPESLGRVYPVELAIVADMQLAVRALINEIGKQASARELKRVATERVAKSKNFNDERSRVLQLLAKEHWDDAPLSAERLVSEMERLLGKDTIIVSDNDSYRPMIDDYLTYGPQAKGFYANAGFCLGWGLPAAFGIKLAKPDRPVVAIVSDGSFLFSGPQPLWSYARYRAPIITVVMNNRSYNNERNRNMQFRGRQYETGRDMGCYLGDPDVDYAKLANGFQIDAEVIDNAAAIEPALKRARQVTMAGRPYLLDVRVARTGVLATSTWHPKHDISKLRTRQV